jgi:hypothetical protein
MRHAVIIFIILLAGSLGIMGNSCDKEKTVRNGTISKEDFPMRPKSFTSRAIVLPPKSIGKVTIRPQAALAVDIRIEVEDYVPMGMEPTLLIDGKPAIATSGLVEVKGNISTLSFIIEQPATLKDGATLGLQMGERVKSRVQVPGVFRTEKIRPLAPRDAKQWKGPVLQDWLMSP